MLGRAVSPAPMINQMQASAQNALYQANLCKETQNFGMALFFYDQAKVAFKHIAKAHQLTPSLSEVKNAVIQAQTPKTAEDEALRQRLAEVYFERAQLLEKLNQVRKAQASYQKAKAWGYLGSEPEFVGPAASKPARRVLARAATSTEIPVQQLQVASSAQEKNVLVDYLFEKALATLGSLEVSNKPSLFLVYAHDNPAHGKAEASTSKYLIDKLSQIRVNLYSDQAPKGEPYSSSLEELKEDGKLEDIVTNQLCLLPTPLRGDVTPVDKVVVCCSEVLGSYLKWADYTAFYQELRGAYFQDREAYRKAGDSSKSSAVAIREVVKKFSLEPAYRDGFHHVLTEIAFLQIRKEQLQDQHGIIPVALTPNSYQACLEHFIPATAVRMEDIPRFENPTQADKVVYENQSRHWVLFKLIERLLVGSDEARTFLNKFWQGYSACISRLNGESRLGELELARLLDGIFDGIRTALHSQLAFTVQQQHRQWQVLNVDPKVTLKAQYDAALKQDKTFAETQQLYVEPRGKAANETVSLLDQMQAFLQSDKQVLLLTGDSGAGKSTFNRLLEKQLWEERNEGDPIPLFIALPSIDKPEQDLIVKILKRRGLSELQIQKIKKEKQKFIFILDGYDEIRQTQNLYLSNQINQPDSWLGQMVVSCRTEYLGQHYQSRFQPNPLLQEKDAFFEEVAIEPFSIEERNAYLEKYATLHAMGWTAQQYQDALEQPHVNDLTQNPFLLRVILEALPYLANQKKARTAIQLRLDLYGQFVRQWFERNEQRLSAKDLAESKREIFIVLCDEGFAEHGIALAQDLATNLYIEQAGNPVVEYSSHKDKGSWKEAFFGRDEEKQLLREAWPLSRNGNQYRFIHKSLLEYLVARALFDSFDACVSVGSRSRRGSNASAYSFDLNSVPSRSVQPTLLLAPKHWCNDLGVVSLLTERVAQESTFKQQLFDIIELSKADKTVRQAAANAITILVRAGVQFNGVDLKGIQIPGADLSEGVFDSAQLQGADLRKVIFRKIWLRRANLSGAKMEGVRFGEWPTLEEKSQVTSCVYSPDGGACVMGLENSQISVYDTSSWARTHILKGHQYSVNSVAYSPSTAQIASGGSDKTVRVWNAQNGMLLHTLKGHQDFVRSVVYSPNGEQIASGAEDTTVRLWNARSGKLLNTLEGHQHNVLSVAYSPNAEWIASGSKDKTVRVWNTQSGELLHILEGHQDAVWSVAYSPHAEQIASGSQDKTVRLWNARSGTLLHTLKGHQSSIRSVTYSPNAEKIVSGSSDGTVRLWEVRSGTQLYSLEGHQSSVKSVAYSPSGEQIVSGSDDKTVRLWDIRGGTLSKPHAPAEHQDHVTSVAYSPNNDLFASGSGDKTVRLWDACSGTLLRTLQEHQNKVRSIAYSPNAEQVASGSEDNTVRLWNAQDGTLLYTLKGHQDYVTSVAYSPNKDKIASGSEDKTVRLWDTRKGGLLNILEGHQNYVWSVAYSPSGKQIASGSWDKTVRLWDTRDGALRYTLEGHQDYVRNVTYSPNGKRVASAGDDKTVRLWSAQNGALLHTLEGHKNWVYSVAYSPNGELIASGSEDKTVRLWNATSGQCLRVLQGFNRAVYSIAWKATNNVLYLASGSEDKSVRQWEVKRKQEGYQVKLSWSSGHEVLMVTEMLLKGVQGLSQVNKRLLQQRGAVGEPVSRLVKTDN